MNLGRLSLPTLNGKKKSSVNTASTKKPSRLLKKRVIGECPPSNPKMLPVRKVGEGSVPVML